MPTTPSLPVVVSITHTKDAPQRLKAWADTLERMQKELSYNLPLGLMLGLIEKIIHLVPTTEEVSKKEYNQKLQALQQSLPTYNPNTIFFPTKGLKNDTKGKAILYTSWQPQKKPSQSIIIKINNTQINCKPLSKGGFGFRFQEPASHKNPLHYLAMAHAIYACVLHYPESRVMISSSLPDHKRLVSYIYAYQHISHRLNNPPLFTVGLEGSRPLETPSSEEINEAIQKITKNDIPLNNFLKVPTC